MTTAMQHLAACSDVWCAFCNDMIRRNDSSCSCIPGRLCGLCEARGYKSALAGYAQRIFPARVTPADDAREARVHYVAPEDGDDTAPYWTCANCGQAVRTNLDGTWQTMLTANRECYGSTYRPGQ